MVAAKTIDKAEQFVKVTVTRVLRDGENRVAHASIQDECSVDLFMNGELLTEFGCSASHLDELAIGHLCTRGIISSIGQVAALHAEGNAIRASVAAEEGGVKPLEPVVPVEWKPEAVFRIADEFALDKTAHARTRGAHSAFLCDLDGRILCMREDIGRHNAFDKVVGWALLHDVDLAQCMLYTSGRVPSDMASKAIRAGIPVLVSKSVATDQGIALARAYGLTLICEARPMQFDIVNS